MARLQLFEEFAKLRSDIADDAIYGLQKEEAYPNKNDEPPKHLWDLLKNYQPAHNQAAVAGEFIAVNQVPAPPPTCDPPQSYTVPEEGTAAPCWVLPNKLPTQVDFFLRVHEEMSNLVTWLDPTEEEQRQREKVAASVKVFARSIWKDCSVKTFGSFYTGLCLPHGDLDICLMNVPGNPRKQLKQLAMMLSNYNVTSGIEVIANARVPIIKYVDKMSRIPVDISLNQNSAVSTSVFIREQLERYPWLRPLIVFIKLYLQQRGLGETYRGGIGSYLLSVMVISFLQQHKITKDSNLQQRCSLGHLLVDFFQLYGVDFNYATTGISVNGDGFYFPKYKRGWYYDERPMLLAAESPLEPDVDIGKNSYNIAIVRNAFRQTWQDLAELQTAWKMGTLPSAECCLLDRIIYSVDPLFERRRPWPPPPPPENGAEGVGILSQDMALPIGQVRPVPKIKRALTSQVASELKSGRFKPFDAMHQNQRRLWPNAEVDYLKRGFMTTNIATHKRLKVDNA